jgi:hypothetical protein
MDDELHDDPRLGHALAALILLSSLAYTTGPQLHDLADGPPPEWHRCCGKSCPNSAKTATSWDLTQLLRQTVSANSCGRAKTAGDFHDEQANRPHTSAPNDRPRQPPSAERGAGIGAAHRCLHRLLVRVLVGAPGVRARWLAATAMVRQRVSFVTCTASRQAPAQRCSAKRTRPCRHACLHSPFPGRPLLGTLARGRRSPNILTLTRMAGALGVRLSHIVREAETPWEHRRSDVLASRLLGRRDEGLAHAGRANGRASEQCALRRPCPRGEPVSLQSAPGFARVAAPSTSRVF